MATDTDASPVPTGPQPPSPEPSSGSLVSYFLQLIGGFRAVGRMGVTNSDNSQTEPTLPTGEADHHATDAERARRGGRFGTTRRDNAA